MKPLRKIVIVGGGTSGWMAAAILSHQLNPDLCQILVVEAEDIPTVGIGESTVPPFVGLIQRLGIDEQAFMRATQATYKLGIQFVDWHQPRSHYFHPFGSIGRSMGPHDFYQCWLKAQALGDTSGLQDFSPCSVMAENGRFFQPGKARQSPIGGASYAYHVDATAVARYLCDYSKARGVKHMHGHVESIERRDNGHITRLILSDGGRVDGDFFIDCTGFRALLLGQSLGVDWLDWSAYLPCDRAVAVKASASGPVPLYTQARARRAGWSWRIPLQGRTGHGYVYSSQFCKEAEARATLLAPLEGKTLGEPVQLAFQAGHRKQIWQHNCLALGLAAGFVEPLESTSIHLIARGMAFFLRYFPDQDCDPALMREYNRRMIADFEEVRDFLVLHYCTSQRRDSPFWRWCQTMPTPDSLAERIELFCGHGALREGVDELFRAASWQSVFEGMGIRPNKHCPRVDNLDPQAILRDLQQAKNAIAGMVRTLPRHEAYLEGI